MTKITFVKMFPANTHKVITDSIVCSDHKRANYIIKEFIKQRNKLSEDYFVKIEQDDLICCKYHLDQIELRIVIEWLELECKLLINKNNYILDGMYKDLFPQLLKVKK